MRRARDDLESAAHEVRELAWARRSAPVDDQRFDLLVAGAEHDAIAARVGDREAGSADLGFAGHEIGEDLLIDIDAQADAELFGIAARELVLDAARLIGAVIKRRWRVASHDPQLPGTQDALEDRGW